MQARSVPTFHAGSEWRHFFDRACAALGLLVGAIPMAITASIVWWVLGRPLLFSQTRSGLNRRDFVIYKFRTMHDRLNAAGVPLPDRERETPVTRLLRRLRLDEFPQLLTVLSGEMALIGPRPLLPATIRQMGELGRRRCEICPGITGWAQVNGNTLLADQQKLALDIWYVGNRSLWLDLKILVLTVDMLIRGERVNRANLAAAEAHVAARYPAPGAEPGLAPCD
jgi:lipopolysaccharide/colanic/teichoic acid biosynthesis glycosyltransferase